MKITFKQVDEQHIDIMCGDKKIGKIFSPGGTGESTPNAIQICGFEEAYDLWGCGVFCEKEIITHEYTEDQIKKFKSIGDPYFDKKTTYTETKVVQKKDIQLLFKDYDDAGFDALNIGDCYKCFNKECTCESEERDKRMTLKDSFNKEFKKRLEDNGYPNTKEEINETLLNNGKVN